MGTLDGRVAVVTGAGRGIGRSIAHALAAAGAAVVVNDLGTDVEGRAPADAGPAGVVVDEIRAAGGTALVSTDSVADFESAGRIVALATDELGRLDVLVNVAGNARRGSIFNLAADDWRDHLAVHLDGTFWTCRHAAPVMRSQGWGRIVNTASDAFTGVWGAPGYTAAKAGIWGLTKAIAVEGSRFGIVANAIAPEAETRLQEYGRALYGGSDRPRAEEHDFDAVPSADCVGPLVVYLASEGCTVTGRMFTIRGAEVALWSDPVPRTWLPGRGERVEPWSADELATAVPDLVRRDAGAG